MTPVLEIARFGLASETDPARVAELAASVTPWLSTQPGFIRRTLAGPDDAGRYTDIVEWSTLEHAEAAAAQFAEQPSVAAFMAAIDTSDVSIQHLDVQLQRS